MTSQPYRCWPWQCGAWVFTDPPGTSSLVPFSPAVSLCALRGRPTSPPACHAAAATSTVPVPVPWQRTQTRPNRQTSASTRPAVILFPFNKDTHCRRKVSAEAPDTDAAHGNMQRMFGREASFSNGIQMWTVHSFCKSVCVGGAAVIKKDPSAFTSQPLLLSAFYIFSLFCACVRTLVC